MRFWKTAVMGGIAVLFLAGPAIVKAQSCSGEAAFSAGCDPDFDRSYDDYTDSHPLRIVAYAVHPVGYAVQWLVTRPIHALVSQPDLQPIFGYKAERLDFCCGIPEATQVTTAAPPPPVPVVSTVDTDAARRAADEARQAAEEAKRAAEEAARAADKATRGFEKTLTK
jgi:hypothetical protein